MDSFHRRVGEVVDSRFENLESRITEVQRLFLESEEDQARLSALKEILQTLGQMHSLLKDVKTEVNDGFSNLPKKGEKEDDDEKDQDGQKPRSLKPSDLYDGQSIADKLKDLDDVLKGLKESKGVSTIEKWARIVSAITSVGASIVSAFYTAYKMHELEDAINDAKRAAEDASTVSKDAWDYVLSTAKHRMEQFVTFGKVQDEIYEKVNKLIEDLAACCDRMSQAMQDLNTSVQEEANTIFQEIQYLKSCCQTLQNKLPKNYVTHIELESALQRLRSDIMADIRGLLRQILLKDFGIEENGNTYTS